MSDLETDLSVAPYYDDYETEKRFYRILFVPKRAVQTRELNQIQSIIQEQIRRFGNHVFKDGSIVLGCNINHVPVMNYIRLENGWNTANSNNAMDKTLQDFLVVSANTGTRASIRLVKQGYENLYPNTNVFYVDYIKSGRDNSNNEVKTFSSGETLTVYNTTQSKLANTLDSNKIYNNIDAFTANVAANQVSSGNTYAISVGEGVVYQKGFFVNVVSHTITVRDFDSEVDNQLVGFQTQESIVSHLQDDTLNDQQVSTTNRNAPGADRLKLEPVLVSKTAEEIGTSDFFPIIQFNGNKPVVQKVEPEYAKLGEVIGGWNDEAHGDYYVKPFIVVTETSANTSTFNYALSSGISYVKGNRIELINTKRVEAVRAIETAESQANIVTLNYGYYVLVNEVAGQFDFDHLKTVDIYNTAQTTLSDLEDVGSGPSGAKIGTATIRGIVYDSGTKGTANGAYRAYISNIVMNSGASFATSAKSLYSNTGSFGNAKADLILESNTAVIKDSSKSSLVFDTGLKGLKRLRDATGVNDTQFYLRDVASATLRANGFATFTLNTPHAGGQERFFSSVGALSNANELRVDVTLSATAYSNTLTGTVDSNTNLADTLSGTSSLFTTQYRPGELVRISANTTSHYIRRVVSIANNTSMTINAPIAQANATAAHRKYFPAGSILNLAANTAVTAISNTQFSVDLNPVTFESGAPQTIYASYPVLRTQAVQATKNVAKDIYVKINCNTNSGGIVGPWNLGIPDVYSISAVYVGSSYSTSNPDRSIWFTLNTGQTKTSYEHGSINIKPLYAANITSATRILVKLSAFQANNSAGIGFYSVDSYPARAPGITANSTNISFAEIPTFDGIELRNAIDFRPSRYATATYTANSAAATENPAIANSSFVVAVAGTYLAEPDSNFQADIEYYLPRIDLIQVNKDGVFNIKKSTGSLNPKTPAGDMDAMSIATAYVPPFPSLTSDERVLYNPDREKITTKQLGNRVYTERDVGALDRRITRLEYYETLSALEQQAKDYTVKDANGLDRFKNGIFADPFNNHLLGDYSNFEYAISIDPENGVARPRVETNPVDFKVDVTTNTVQNGQILNLPFTPTLFIQQSSASKFRTVTESVWNWSGDLSIYPSYDHFRDEKTLPDINVTLDLTTAWDQFAASPFASNFGDWRTVANTAASTSSTSTSGSTRTTTTTTTTSTTMQQTIDQLKVGSSLSTYNLGSYVADFSINPYMRSREVAFIVSGLKPNSNFWVYFDSVPVSQHCAPGTISTSYDEATGTISVTEGNESQVVVRSAAWGTQLVSSATGDLYGLFKIPEATFKVGDRQLLIANVDDLVTGDDAITSAARATYTASSTTVSTRETNLNTINPVISTQTTTDTIVQKSTNVTQTRQTIPNRTTGERGGSRGYGRDPLGQSFFVEPPSDVPGIFLNKIGVYFKAKDPSLGMTCVITELTAGVPDTSKTVAKAYLKPSEISTSIDGSAETQFVFNNIPYLTSGKYYAFFLRPDGNSPEYLLYMAEIGGTDILTGQKIFSNPNIGVAFTSANDESWNILQTEDVKFNIYRCDFTSLQGTATFADQDDEYIVVNGFTVANTSTSIEVGDVVYTQNSTGGLLTSNSSPTGIVQYIDYSTDTIILDGSRGGFTTNTVIQVHRPPQAANVSALTANTLIANGTIKTIDNYDYSIVVPRFGLVTPFGTNISMRFKGMDSTETVDSSWIAIQPEVEYELNDKMRTIKSKSNRIGVSQSAQFELTLTSPSSYITPLVDLRRKAGLFIENIVNNDLTNEQTRYGNALTKYLSQPIVLAEGQDAEDIRVIISGYRPPETDIVCYVKFKNAEDPDEFVTKLWTKMEMTAGSSVYSNALDPRDMREFEFGLPIAEALQGQAWCEQSNLGILQYRNAAGSIYVGYKQFAIKLVLVSARKERIPMVDDVRSIALQI